MGRGSSAPRRSLDSAFVSMARASGPGKKGLYLRDRDGRFATRLKARVHRHEVPLLTLSATRPTHQLALPLTILRNLFTFINLYIPLT